MGQHAQSDITKVETELRAAVAERLGETRFGLWFGEGVHLGVDGDALEVRVPNAFFREWIQGHFASNLIEAAEVVVGRPLRLTFQIDAEAVPQVGHVVHPLLPRDDRRSQAPFPSVPAPPVGPSERPRSQARPLRRLEHFVTGPGNQLAHAAVLEMAQSAGAAFNPLVIQGGIGLGKSHLLEGLGAALRARHPTLVVVQITAEGFTNSFLDAMRSGSLSSFRGRYRSVGALLVDDVHFLAAKRATQDEFLHTFNALADAGAPIALSADQHPRRIARLCDELVTRFLGGMVVKLEPPDLATRRAILKAKAIARGVDVPDPVLDFVAEHLRASVRELEGALHSLLAHALLTGRRIDLTLARLALRDTIRHTAQAVALRDVERAVCELFQVEPDTLKSEGRARVVAYPRMLAMYLARKHTGAAYSEIGRFFGGRNHSTVIAAERKVAAWLRDEQQNGLLAGFETVADALAALDRSLGG
ncbi:MAG TPA: chromosomal replication initiator protein DnaA [Isosphaeraceae bacterium]|jgi:chromosomal replication initiator protein|nr:chromosomal replication initiator protein DnaA [Isosphaeraceae bacterium]